MRHARVDRIVAQSTEQQRLGESLPLINSHTKLPTMCAVGKDGEPDVPAVLAVRPEIKKHSSIPSFYSARSRPRRRRSHLVAAVSGGVARCESSSRTAQPGRAQF